MDLRRENGGGDGDNYMRSCRIGGDTSWQVLLAIRWTFTIKVFLSVT